MVVMHLRVAMRFKRAYAEPVRVRELSSGKELDISREMLKANPGKYTTVHRKFVEPTAEDVIHALTRAQSVSWGRPDLDHEWEEIQRCGTEEGIEPRRIYDAAHAASLVELDEGTWSRLQGSESYGIGHLVEAIHYARMFDKNIAAILRGIGGEMDAPIVLVKPGGVPVLVGGNTRLMAFRALGIRPNVLLVRLPS